MANVCPCDFGLVSAQHDLRGSCVLYKVLLPSPLPVFDHFVWTRAMETYPVGWMGVAKLSTNLRGLLFPEVLVLLHYNATKKLTFIWGLHNYAINSEEFWRASSSHDFKSSLYFSGTCTYIHGVPCERSWYLLAHLWAVLFSRQAEWLSRSLSFAASSLWNASSRHRFEEIINKSLFAGCCLLEVLVRIL